MKQFRLSGILPKDTDILRLMDSEASGYSNLIAVRFTKDGGVSGNSLVPSSEFNILLKYVKDMVGRIAGEIYSGNIEIKPYRKSRERACRFCPYSSFCIFDVLLKGNKYNILNKLTVDEAWSNIKAAVKEGESNG